MEVSDWFHLHEDHDKFIICVSPAAKSTVIATSETHYNWHFCMDIGITMRHKKDFILQSLYE